jgi:hypothetical protein
MHLSISQIADFTGRDGRTVAKQLKDLHYTAGERGISVATSSVLQRGDYFCGNERNRNFDRKE